jgi:hypothetical protein
MVMWVVVVLASGFGALGCLAAFRARDALQAALTVFVAVMVIAVACYLSRHVPVADPPSGNVRER